MPTLNPTPDPAPRPSLRAGGSVSGDSLCPRCGAYYRPPEGCAACGYPNPPPRAPMRLISMDALIGGASKLIFALVVAALAWWAFQPAGGEPRYRLWWRNGLKPALVTMGIIEDRKTITCPDCRGAKRIPCMPCEGRGNLQSKREVPCAQCNGTGRYQRRLSATQAPCPFCHATGKRSEAVTVSCANCGGAGQWACPGCAGAGTIITGARKP